MDRAVFVWVVEHRAGPLDPVFVGLGVVGYAGLLWLALAALVVLRAGRPPFRTLAAAAIAVWGADLATLAIKAAVGRPRPFETVPEADPLLAGTVGSSFPSGHAATSFAGAVILSYLVPRAAPALLALAFAVAFSRVYVGVHYPADVLAGAALGCVAGLAGTRLVRAPRSPGRGRPQRGGVRRGG